MKNIAEGKPSAIFIERKFMKVFVTDLDGTLLNENRQLTPEMEMLIRLIRDKGYYFGIATGRPFFSAESAFDRIQDQVDFAICNNGGDIHDFISGEVHEQYPLSGSDVSEILDFGRALGGNAILGFDDILHIDFEDEYSKMMANYVDVEVGDIKPLIKDHHAKIIFRGSPEVLKKIAEYDAEHPKESYKAFMSQADLIEFMDPRVNKLTGIEWFCQTHDIDIKDVMAFGDADNDIEMVAGVGVGIAMENATESVKAVAKHVTYANTDNGVYRYLIEYMSM
jgi:Cof subfamily protein (haloacid dehalogenase superfamily)